MFFSEINCFTEVLLSPMKLLQKKSIMQESSKLFINSSKLLISILLEDGEEYPGVYELK